MFICNICNKSFLRKYHLTRHQNNKKKCTSSIENSKNNEEVSQNNEEAPQKNEEAPQKIEGNEENLDNGENEENENIKQSYICSNCNKEYSRKDNLNRHIDKYCKNIMKNRENNVIIELLNENKKILDKMKDLEEKVINAPPSIINNTHNNTHNIHVTNNILNFNDLNYSIDEKFIYKCLRDGFLGDIEYLRRVYLHDIPKENRPIKCLDPSRDKCVVRKNGEWIASTGSDIYKQSLKHLIDNYLIVNNNMLDENQDNKNNEYDIKLELKKTDIIYDDNNDIHEYINTYSSIDNMNTSNNTKIDEYMNNLNRITRMMESKNIDKVSKHMNILLK